MPKIVHAQLSLKVRRGCTPCDNLQHAQIDKSHDAVVHVEDFAGCLCQVPAPSAEQDCMAHNNKFEQPQHVLHLLIGWQVVCAHQAYSVLALRTCKQAGEACMSLLLHCLCHFSMRKLLHKYAQAAL